MTKEPANTTIAAPVARKPRRDKRHVWLATLLVAVVCAGAIWAFTLHSRNVEMAADPARATAALDQHEQRRSGVIVLRNADGTLCEKRRLDNASGTLHGRERVPCDPSFNPAQEQPQVQYHPGARLDAIRSAFQPKKQ